MSPRKGRAPASFITPSSTLQKLFQAVIVYQRQKFRSKITDRLNVKGMNRAQRRHKKRSGCSGTKTDIKSDFPGGPVVKNPPANAGDTGSIPDLGRSHVLQDK